MIDSLSKKKKAPPPETCFVAPVVAMENHFLFNFLEKIYFFFTQKENKKEKRKCNCPNSYSDSCSGDACVVQIIKRVSNV